MILKNVLTEENKNDCMDMLEQILQENTDIKLGIIQRDKILELIEKELGLHYYNKGVKDAIKTVESCQEVFEEKLDLLIQ